MDTLLAGAICAVIVRNELQAAFWKPWLTLIIAVAGVCFFAIDFLAGELWDAGRYMQTVGYTILAIGYSALLLKAYYAARRSKLRALLETQPLRTIGKYSYGIYVFHVPILTAFILIFSNLGGIGRRVLPSALAFAVLCGLSFVTAAASYKNFEMFFLRLKDRIAPELPAKELVP